MEQSKKDKIIAAGFQVGTVQEFLELSDEEMAAIEHKIQEYSKTKINKKLIKEYDIEGSILLDADSLLNELERGTIDPNE